MKKIPTLFVRDPEDRRLNMRKRRQTRRWNKQRIERGFSDYDLWSFGHFLAKTIRDGALELDRITHGYPADLTVEKWSKILHEIADGMQASVDIINMNYDFKDETAHDELMKRYKKGMKLLNKHWFSLWD